MLWFGLWTVDKSPWMNQRLTRESIVKDSTIILKFCPNSVFKLGISQLFWNFVRIRYFAIKDITVVLKFRPHLVFFMILASRNFIWISMEWVAVVSVALSCYKSGSLSPPSSLRRARNHVTKSILILNYSARPFTRVWASAFEI